MRQLQQNRLLLSSAIGAVCSGSMLFASILNLSVLLGNYLQQMTSADDIFRCIFTCVALAKAGLVVGPLRLYVRPQHFRVPSLCNLLLQKFSFFFIQTLPNDCTYIEDVHLLFCARFIIFCTFLMGVELRHFFNPQC